MVSLGLVKVLSVLFVTKYYSKQRGETHTTKKDVWETASNLLLAKL